MFILPVQRLYFCANPVADLRLFLAPPAEWIPDITDSSGKDDEDRDKLRSTNKSENK